MNLLNNADDKTRKSYPVLTGVLDYFPNALLAIAEVSRLGNEQHNPGQPLHWAKEKSTDHGNTAVRHIMQRGTRDADGGRHTAKAAWRILAMLETEIEAEGRIAAALDSEPALQEQGAVERRVAIFDRRVLTGKAMIAGLELRGICRGQRFQSERRKNV